MKLRVTTLGGLLVSGCMCAWGGSVQDHLQYYVEGKLTWHALDKRAAAHGEFVSAGERSSYSFTAEVDDCRWSVSLSPLALYLPEEDRALGNVSTNWSMLVASDGREFCRVMVRRPGAKPEAAYSAVRGPGASPIYVDRKIVMVWYAYCSHCVLAEAASNLLVPMESIGANTSISRVPAHWNLSSNPPGLPELLTTYGYRISENSQLELLPPREDIPNVVLKVHSTTNINGLKLPLRSFIHYYWVSYAGGVTTAEPHDFASMETLSVKPVATLSEYPPKISGRYHITDYRFGSDVKDPTNAVKILTQTGWVSDSAVASMAHTANARSNARSGSKWVMRALFFSSLIPFGLFLRRILKKNKHDHESVDM